MCFLPGAPGRLGEYMSTEDLACGHVGARAEHLLFLDINHVHIRNVFPA